MQKILKCMRTEPANPLITNALPVELIGQTFKCLYHMPDVTELHGRVVKTSD